MEEVTGLIAPSNVVPSTAGFADAWRSLGRLRASRRWSIRLVRLALFAALVVVAARGVLLAVVALASPFAYKRDFLEIYVLARAITAGADPLLPLPILASRYIGVWTTAFPHPTPHPPTAGAIFAPLAWLGYRQAAVAWLAFQVASLVLSTYLLARSFGQRPSGPRLLGYCLLGLAWFPVQADLFWGNFNLVLLAPLCGIWFAVRHRRPYLAGGLLGLELLIKPVAWPVFLAFALRRDWRASGATVGIVGLGYAVVGWLVGYFRLVRYFTRVLPEVSAYYAAANPNTSLSNIGWRLFAGATNPIFTGDLRPIADPIVASPVAASVLAVALPLAATAACALIVSRWPAIEWRLALTVCLSVVVNPISWEHYEVLLIVPLAFLGWWLYQRAWPVRPTASLVVVGLLLLVPRVAGDSLALVLAGQTDLSPAAPLPAGLSLLNLGPVLTVVALAVLIVILGNQANAAEARRPLAGIVEAPAGREGLP